MGLYEFFFPHQAHSDMIRARNLSPYRTSASERIAAGPDAWQG